MEQVDHILECLVTVLQNGDVQLTPFCRGKEEWSCTDRVLHQSLRDNRHLFNGAPAKGVTYRSEVVMTVSDSGKRFSTPRFFMWERVLREVSHA